MLSLSLFPTDEDKQYSKRIIKLRSLQSGLALTFPMRWPDSTFSASFADNFMDDAQPHDEADDTHPIWDGQVWFK